MTVLKKQSTGLVAEISDTFNPYTPHHCPSDQICL